MNIVFWWPIPCEGIVNVFVEYSKIHSGETVIVTGKLSSHRRSMGWQENKKLMSSHIILQEKNFLEQSFLLLEKYNKYYHVFCGVTYPKMDKLIHQAIKMNLIFCNMSESYCNFDYSIKRPLKILYHKVILPFLHKKVAVHSKGIFCLSGSSMKELKKMEHCGWGKSQIIPFGYYTEEKKYDNSKNEICAKVQIICPGLLERYKGVHILLKAIRILSQKNITQFHCHITGLGSQQSRLKRIASKFNVEEYVTFHGVIEYDKYDELYKTIDLLIAPGIIEPWGIRVNEAIQRGIAVIVSDGLGASELVNTEGGRIFKSKDYLQLSNYMSEYILDRELLKNAKNYNIVSRSKIRPSVIATQLQFYLKQIFE
jgi:glycosyltransferase involved in cell wall biosynthesis